MEGERKLSGRKKIQPDLLLVDPVSHKTPFCGVPGSKNIFFYLFESMFKSIQYHKLRLLGESAVGALLRSPRRKRLAFEKGRCERSGEQYLMGARRTART